MTYSKQIAFIGVIALACICSINLGHLNAKILDFKNKETTMLEVLNIEAVNKGSLLCKCDVRIIPWQMTLRGICVFEKGQNRWITLPSKEFDDNMTGAKKYVEMIPFDTDSVKQRFRNQIMGAIDKYLKENPEMKGKDVIQESDGLPW